MKLFYYAFMLLTYIACNSALAQLSPPALGEETKGTPAVDETSTSTDNAVSNTDDNSKTQILGNTEVTEYRRENGQLHRIKLQHSAGNTQYIEETDSDGRIGSTNNDIEDTPNLPKWKLGSW